MSDHRAEKKHKTREQRERRGRRDGAESKRGASIERMCRDVSPEPRGLDRAKEKLARLDRIAERDSMRRLPGFDPERVRKLEDLEIKTSPEGFARRHEGKGLDEATRREVCRAAKERVRGK